MRRILFIILLILIATTVAVAWYFFLYPRGDNAITSVDYPVIGIDVSAHNGPDLNFDTLRNVGAEFVMIKATEGVSIKDSRFHSNYYKAKEAGLKIGAYHFFRFDCTGMMQALNLMHSVRGKELDLPLIIDVEEWTNPVTHPTPGIMESLIEMIEYLDTHGYPVMIYTNKNGYERFVKGRLENYPLWLCSLSELTKDIKCHIWQFSHRGSLNGASGPIDLNAFVGSREEWTQWLDSINSLQ